MKLTIKEIFDQFGPCTVFMHVLEKFSDIPAYTLDSEDFTEAELRTACLERGWDVKHEYSDTKGWSADVYDAAAEDSYLSWVKDHADVIIDVEALLNWMYENGWLDELIWAIDTLVNVHLDNRAYRAMRKAIYDYVVALSDDTTWKMYWFEKLNTSAPDMFEGRWRAVYYPGAHGVYLQCLNSKYPSPELEALKELCIAAGSHSLIAVHMLRIDSVRKIMLDYALNGGPKDA